MAVPDFGLTLGQREESFDDFTLRLSLTSTGKTALEWLKPDGKLQKSVPAFVKQSKKHSDHLKKIRDLAKQVQKYSTAQRDRIDRSYLEERSWSYEEFLKLYHQHGLVSFLARRLIWIFEIDGVQSSAMWRDDRWLDQGGEEVRKVDQANRVLLWHPLLAEQEQVLDWRERLQEWEVQQPMKQAYREVYLLTDAEVTTGTYSNRMAAHILKQHQFNALAGIRGWKYTLMGAFDGDGDQFASKPLPTHDLVVQYWINSIHSDNEWTDAGIYHYIATDQVRFTRLGEPVNLVDIPKMVLSEVLRDVDLFVGVCSVGNDPEWRDGGVRGYADYWSSYSFGDLSEVAKTRSTVLEDLLPRLKIRNVARIDGKFLRVKGTLREYKIHIGSTNILMEPNDQYLCIVPARSSDRAADKLFLPFEGDRGLSLIISKATLLAADHKITDETILSQINGK